MTSTVLEFGEIPSEDVDVFSLQLRSFLEGIISREYFGEASPERFGPILFVGPLRDPRDGTYLILLQTYVKHADTLFCALDEFSNACYISLEYERSDK